MVTSDDTKPALPEAPHERRVIVPLDEADRSVLRTSDEGKALLLDDSVAVLDLPLGGAGQANEIVARLLKADLVVPRVPVLQSPTNPQVYYDLHDAGDRTALEKVFNAIELCQILGAQTVRILQAEREKDSVELEGSAKAKRLGGEVEMTAAAKEIKSLERETQAHNSFRGDDPDPEGARQFLAEKGLDHDPHLNGLVAMRRRQNTLLSHTLKVSTRTESERLRRWATKARIPLGEGTLTGEYAAQRVLEWDIEFEVNFERATQAR